MKIVFASHTARVGVFRVGSHHLSRELARCGHSVFHVSTPVSFAHLPRIWRRPIRDRFGQVLGSPKKDADGVWHVVPFVPVPIRVISPALARAELRAAVKRWQTTVHYRDQRPDVLVIDQPLFYDLIDILRPRRVVYRPTDAHFDARSRAAELKIVGRAHAIVATSHPVLTAVTEGSGFDGPTLVLENGVEYERFCEIGSSRARSGVVYLGAIDQRFDWQAVRTLAGAFIDTEFTLAGPISSQPPVQLPQNVILTGPTPYSDAPALLNAATVGILPFSTDPGNLGRSPMKYYEYLAAGLNVVSSWTPVLAAREGPGVALYRSLPQACRMLGKALNAPSPNHLGRAYAAGFGWTTRARELMDFVGSIGQGERG